MKLRKVWPPTKAEANKSAKQGKVLMHCLVRSRDVRSWQLFNPFTLQIEMFKNQPHFEIRLSDLEDELQELYAWEIHLHKEKDEEEKI